MTGDNAIGTTQLQQGSGFTGTALTTNGGTLNFDLSSTGADSLLVSKSASVIGANTINLTALGTSLSVGSTYNLITAASGMTGTFQFGNGASSELVVVGANTYLLTLLNTATQEKLSVAAAASLTSLTWTGQTGGDWRGGFELEHELQATATGRPARCQSATSMACR